MAIELDHDDFGSNRSEIINVIDSFKLERDAGGKPVPTFPHPAPDGDSDTLSQQLLQYYIPPANWLPPETVRMFARAIF